MNINKDLKKLNENIQNSNLEISNTIKKIPIDLIKKNDNNFYSINYIEELSENIKINGLITPLIVTKAGNNYKLISGHRRLEALKLLKIVEVESIIVEYDNKPMEQLALLEANSQRVLTKEERDQEIKLKKKIYTQLKLEGKLGSSNIDKLLSEEYGVTARTIRRAVAKEDKMSNKDKVKKSDEEILSEDLKKLNKLSSKVLSSSVRDNLDIHLLNIISKLNGELSK